MSEFKEISLYANGLNFHCLQVGKGEKPIIILHGFPDTPYSFLGLMKSLAGSGYSCFAPFMRGYAPSEVPLEIIESNNRTVQIYDLARDISGIIQALGYEKTSLVGHDWGSIAAYSAANLNPKQIDRLVLLSVPPIPSFLKNTFLNPIQILRSWYMLFFQLGFNIPETIFKSHNFAMMNFLWERWSPLLKEKFHIQKVKDSLANHTNLRTALSYYRGLFQPSLFELDTWLKSAQLVFTPISVPTLLLHGSEDGCIGEEIFMGSSQNINAYFQHIKIQGAGHFIPLEEPDRLYKEIYNFLY